MKKILKHGHQKKGTELLKQDHDLSKSRECLNVKMSYYSTAMIGLKREELLGRHDLS